jgi:cytochrome bd ubiquinol oxidase subunit II
MSTADVCAVILWAGVTLYAIFGGADFGAGVWDLLAGSGQPESGGADAPPLAKQVRGQIDRSIGPVWEANHVWLIFVLVVLWTAFPTTFSAVMTTLYIPLALAALGIVLRGSGFAFRKVSMHTAEQRLNGIAFAASSVITPYCFGAVAGGIASGRVPSEGHGDPMSSWVNPTSVLGGVLAVLTCGYLAAIFLTAEAHREGEPDLEQWSRLRAVAAGVAAGAVAVAGLFVLRHDSPRLYTELLHRGWPLVVASALAGAGALVAVLRPGLVRPDLVRPLGALAVATVLAGWGSA